MLTVMLMNICLMTYAYLKVVQVCDVEVLSFKAAVTQLIFYII